MAFCMSSTSFLVSFSSLSKELARCPTSASSCRNMSLTSKQQKYNQHCTQRTPKSEKGHTVLGQNGLLQICWNNALYVCSVFWLAQLFQCLTNAVRNGREHIRAQLVRNHQNRQDTHKDRWASKEFALLDGGKNTVFEQAKSKPTSTYIESSLLHSFVLYCIYFIDTWRVHHLGQQQWQNPNLQRLLETNNWKITETAPKWQNNNPKWTNPHKYICHTQNISKQHA